MIIPDAEKSKNSIIDRLGTHLNTETVKTIESNSTILAPTPTPSSTTPTSAPYSTIRTPPVSAEAAKWSESTLKTSSNKMNYYTSDSEYLLDQEIAEDMAKYLFST